MCWHTTVVALFISGSSSALLSLPAPFAFQERPFARVACCAPPNQINQIRTSSDPLLVAHAEALPADGADAAHGVELAVAELDAGVADHAGVVAQDAGDGFLGGDAGVVAHGEVVARRVPHLMRRHGPRQREDAPVGQAPDHAPLAQDEGARRRDDFFYFGEVAGSDLGGGGGLAGMLVHSCLLL